MIKHDADNKRESLLTISTLTPYCYMCANRIVSHKCIKWTALREMRRLSKLKHKKWFLIRQINFAPSTPRFYVCVQIGGADGEGVHETGPESR